MKKTPWFFACLLVVGGVWMNKRAFNEPWSWSSTLVEELVENQQAIISFCVIKIIFFRAIGRHFGRFTHYIIVPCVFRIHGRVATSVSGCLLDLCEQQVPYSFRKMAWRFYEPSVRSKLVSSGKRRPNPAYSIVLWWKMRRRQSPVYRLYLILVPLSPSSCTKSPE